MSNKIKYIAITIILIFSFNFIMNEILERVVSKFIISSIEIFKKDSTIMKDIGGFRSFKTQFDNEKFNNGDTTNFSVQIMGYERYLLFSGTVVKTPTKWTIVKADTIIKNYE